MSTNTQDAMEQEIINRASHDADFRQSLLDNPKAAIADLLNVVLPPGMQITVLEQQPGQHILVLPPLVPTPEALPLNDLELSLVGGGRTLRPGGAGNSGCLSIASCDKNPPTFLQSSC